MIGDRAVALQQALRHHAQGLTRYGDSRLEATIEELGRARKLAGTAGSLALEDRCRFWEGAALHGSGRLDAALATWGPALSRGEDVPLDRSRYMALTRLLLVAIDFPLPLATIEKALEQTEARLKQPGSTGGARRSRILLARARLALSRGRTVTALGHAQEALERSRHESETYSCSTYFRTLTHTALLADEPALVPRYLEEWERLEHAYPHTKRLQLAAARADLARYRDRPAEALAIAAPLQAEIRSSEDAFDTQQAAVSFVRACLAAALPGRARNVVARAAARRRSSVGRQRFDSYLLLGDYHLARLRGHRTGTVQDDQFPHGERMMSVEWREVAPLESEAVRGRRAYSRARAEGRCLDELLRCDHWEAIARERMQRLEPLVETRRPWT